MMPLKLNSDWKIEYNQLNSGEKVEDLFQASSRHTDGSSLTLDAGWYQSIYKVVLIKNFNWEIPVEEKECNCINEVIQSIQSLSKKTT